MSARYQERAEEGRRWIETSWTPVLSVIFNNDILYTASTL